MSNKENGSSFLEGLLLGTILGGVIGMLFAPQSGEKSREWIKKIKDDNQDVIDDALATSEHVIDSAKKSIEDGFKKVSQLIEEKIPKENKKKK